MSTDTLEYKGYEILVDYDNDLSFDDAFPEFEGLQVTSGYNWGANIEELGGFDLDIELTRDQIKTHCAAICELLGYKSLIALYQDFKDHYNPADYDVVSMVNETINDKLENTRASHYCSLLVDLYSFKGIKADYVNIGDQSSVAYMLAIETVENGYSILSLQSIQKYYQEGLFYYTFSDEDLAESGTGCGGFIGYDHEKSGLLEYARADIDSYIEEKAKKRQQETIDKKLLLDFKQPAIV